MKFPHFALCAPIVIVFIALGVSAQQSAPQPAPSTLDNSFVQKAFGEDCTLNPGVQVQVSDFNNDGIEDIVIPARCTNPMENTAEHNYTVIDPAMAFYGLGDPHITTQFSTLQPEQRSMALLVIHGTGKDAWKSATPKAKFLIVNLPYKDISAKKFRIKKKKAIEAIYVEELSEDQMTSVIFWDGKKYKYQPLGSAMQ